MSGDAPLLRIVRGEPTREELAALVTVLLATRARHAAPPLPPRRPVSAWTDRARALRRPLEPGPGRWRASAWPS